MANEYRTATSRVKAMGQTLASQKDVVVGWMKQEQEATITKQKCLEIWDTFKGFDFDSLLFSYLKLVLLHDLYVLILALSQT